MRASDGRASQSRYKLQQKIYSRRVGFKKFKANNTGPSSNARKSGEWEWESFLENISRKYSSRFHLLLSLFF